LKITDLKPGMEGLDLVVTVLELAEVRELKTKTGNVHRLVDGLVADASGRMAITFWDEQTGSLGDVKIGDLLRISNCFMSSYKGERRINVGRDSSLKRVDSP